jgi:hypothetical protein
MGYRSNVVYVFYTLKPDVIPLSLIKLWFDENYPKLDFGEVKMGEDYIKVSYEDVKWYDAYDDVEAVRRAVEIFNSAFETDDKENVAYESIRVGEESTDIEHDGSAYSTYRLHVSREIHFD